MISIILNQTNCQQGNTSLLHPIPIEKNQRRVGVNYPRIKSVVYAKKRTVNF